MFLHFITAYNKIKELEDYY